MSEMQSPDYRVS